MAKKIFEGIGNEKPAINEKTISLPGQ